MFKENFVPLISSITRRTQQQSQTAAIIDVMAIIEQHPFMNENSKADISSFIDFIFFNIYTYLPHESVADFVNKYSTLLINRVRYGSGEWIIQAADPTQFKSITNSIEFDNHPFLSFPFQEGKLEIDNLEFEDGIQTNDVRIRFTFLRKKEAFYAFEYLCNSFENLSTEKQSQVLSGVHMIEYVNSNVSDIVKGISLILAKDKFINRYSLLVYPNPYRIHFLKK